MSKAKNHRAPFGPLNAKPPCAGEHTAVWHKCTMSGSLERGVRLPPVRIGGGRALAGHRLNVPMEPIIHRSVAQKRQAAFVFAWYHGHAR